MKFSNEREFETYVRLLIDEHISSNNPEIFALEKKSVDILFGIVQIWSDAALEKGEGYW